jgi:glutamine synthetase
VPQLVATKGYGYLEDRRPGANADPYIVAACLVGTVCGIEVSFDSSGPLADAA